MPTPEFPNAPNRFDPYKSFRFRVKWDGRYIAGISKVSGLTRTTQVVEHRPGGDASTVRRSPGQTDFAPITLERGVTHDPAFEQWANKVWDYKNSVTDDQQGGSHNQIVSLKDFRKNITIELYNEAGQKVLAYNVFRCWVSEYQALPALDSSADTIAIQHLVLQNEGWERDPAVVPPAEPAFNDPAS